MCHTGAPTCPLPMPSGCSTTPGWVTSSSSPAHPVRSGRPKASAYGSTTLSVGKPRARSPDFAHLRTAYPRAWVLVWVLSVPAELVQSLVVDTEVVRDLVHHGDCYLLQDLLAGLTHAQRRTPEDGDPVRECPRGPAAVAPGQRRAVVHAEQLWVVRGRFVLNEEDHVVHEGKQLGGDVVERVSHGLVELFCGHRQHISQTATLCHEPAWCGETTEMASMGHAIGGFVATRHEFGTAQWLDASERAGQARSLPTQGRRAVRRRV